MTNKSDAQPYTEKEKNGSTGTFTAALNPGQRFEALTVEFNLNDAGRWVVVGHSELHRRNLSIIFLNDITKGRHDFGTSESKASAHYLEYSTPEIGGHAYDGYVNLEVFDLQNEHITGSFSFNIKSSADETNISFNGSFDIQNLIRP